MKIKHIVLFISIIILSFSFIGCSNETSNKEENIKKFFDEYNTVEELQDYLEKSGIVEKYPLFDFSIEELDNDGRFYIQASSLEWNLDDAEEMVKSANNDGIRIFTSMGSIHSCYIFYPNDDNGNAGWIITGNDEVQKVFESGKCYSKKEIQDFLDEFNNYTLNEGMELHLLVSAYKCIINTEVGGVADLDTEYAKLLAEFYDVVIDCKEYVVERTENNKTVYDHYYAPIDYKEDANTLTLIYSNGKTLIINLQDWTTTVGSIADNNSDVSTNSSELEQKLFDSINYALSIGMTSNCDMSQETLKELYEKIEDGSFFEESMFSYVTEYGKDRYNYEITYDSLNVIVYCDYTTGLYGFEIEMTE